MPRIHPQLPYEVIQSELLPRLPAKSIGRFRCVCKAWNSFLSTPDFARTHLPYQTNHKLLLLDHWRSPTFRTLDCEPPNHDSITTHPIPFTDNVCILASLDGLVCVALFKTQELPEFAFWNPLTGAYKKFHTSVLNTISGAFAFYKDSSNDYKLLHIASEGAFIYSRRLGSWRKIINPSLETIYHVTKFPWSHATFFAAKVYFMLGNKSVEGERRLISFDVESEKFKEIQFPRVPCGACLGASLVALNGCIHLCVACKNISGGSFDMCKMDGDGWIKMATYTRAQCNPVRLREIHTTKSANWLAICEDNINSFKNIDIEDFVTDLYYHQRMCWPHEYGGAIYAETLVSPNH